MSNKKIIRNDIIVILTPLVIALVFSLIILLTRNAGSTLKITLEGEELARYSLSDDIQKEIYDHDGNFLLTLIVKNGEAFVKDSVCADHSCEKMGKISHSGQSIICLYSRLVISVEGDSSLVDAVAYIGTEVKNLP